jgi:hypothetical protein
MNNKLHIVTQCFRAQADWTQILLLPTSCETPASLAEKISLCAAATAHTHCLILSLIINQIQ